jgi:hypothetical protein
MSFFKYIPILTMLYSMTVWSQNENAGTRVFEFLKLDDNARTISMGGASVAIPNGLYGASINPAVCGFLDKTQAMLGYQSLLMDAWAGPMGYAKPYRNYGVFTGTLHYLSHGYLDASEALDESGKSTGATWHVFSLVGSVGWSKMVYKNLSTGVAIKGIHHYIGSSQQYHASADGIAVDVGFQYRMDYSRFIVAGAFQNMGFLISNYTQETEKRRLPYSATVGISYIPLYIPDLRLACDLQKSNDDYLNYKPGFEATIYKKMIFLRGGFGFSEQDLEETIKELRNKPDDNYIKSNAAGLTLGVGLITDLKGVVTKMDFAYMNRLYGLPPSAILSFLFEY